MAEEIEKQKPPAVRIGQNGIQWTVSVYSSNFVRQFPSNAIVFINTGTSDVRINDIYILPVGASLELSCNQSEVDFTMYKAGFTAGGQLSIWYKQDYGTDIVSEYKNRNVRQKDMPSKREADKKRKRYARDKGDF